MGEQAAAAITAGAVHGDIPPGAELPRAGSISLGAVPTGLTLRRTAMSHGWCALAPTAYDAGRDVLHRTLRLPSAGPRTVSIRQRADGRLTASWAGGPVGTDDRRAIRAQCRDMLALDDDLTELHAACRRSPQLAWAAELGVGRLLRSPTVFEDLTKTLATTNCSWALTRLMCRRLVDSLGERGANGETAFPTAEAVAAAGVAHFTDAVRAGYRARAFVELAERVASGELPVESWRDPARSDDEVLDAVRSLRGFGPYAAQGMLGLLGRPRGLALDSWVRATLPRLVGVPAMTDAQIADRYAEFGRWAGVALWLELTRDWFD